VIRNCDSDRRNSDSEISRKAKRSGKIRKIATFAQQFALINSVLLVISNFSIHKLLEVAHVYVVRADSNSRGRLNLWLKQLRRHLRRERNPPRRRPPRRQCASRRRRRQRGELPKPVYDSRVLDWASGLGNVTTEGRALSAKSFQMAGDSDTRPGHFFLSSIMKTFGWGPADYSGIYVTASILWPSGSKTKPP